MLFIILILSVAGMTSDNHRVYRDSHTSVSDSVIYEVSPFDLVINEIMVRPPTSSGLPEVEYIELYNRSSKPVNIKYWTITVGTSSRIIPGHRIIEPGDFLLLADERSVSQLDVFGEVAGIPSFPVLPVGGQTIVLRDASANIISAIRYSDKWYGDGPGPAGGRSIEQIDPYNPCGGALNWSASTDMSGGTPGRINSVNRSNPDRIAPKVVRASILSKSSVRLHFSEPMHPAGDWLPEGFSAGKAGQPLYAYPVRPFYDAVDLYFGAEFSEHHIYPLQTAGERLYDCAGNFMGNDDRETRFALPEMPLAGEVIINEILFNPLPGGASFIELVNNSRRVFDLNHMVLSGTRNAELDPSYIIAPGGYLFFPEEYLVLTTGPEKVMDHYYTPSPDVFLQMERLPPLYNEKGRIIISDLQLGVIDDVSYSATMHSPLLTTTRGVSLERLGFDLPSSDRHSWHSASEGSGFATPGHRNSQSVSHSEAGKSVISVDPKIFSPDHHGYDYAVNISYDLEKPGYAGSITIFDSRGRLVRRLVRNELLSMAGKYSWDGRNEANHPSPRGIYVIILEIFHPDGEIRNIRESVVLAR